MQALPQARFYNLFGPTETNVCTYFAVPPTLAPDAFDVPIGKPCEHLTVELLNEQAEATPIGQEGEICVAGPTVMKEYFRRPLATSVAFHERSLFSDGQARYRTGDIARADSQGVLWFLGRHDRMVKRRGYRIELGEIEAAFGRCTAIREVAVFTATEGDNIRVRVAVVLQEGQKTSALTLKAHCGKLLPPYMVPDSISIVSEIPRTPNGKVDLANLGEKCTGQS
jgi:acyl-CoA synthetase (AMP-forming)/AMP-acid ligase II